MRGGDEINDASRLVREARSMAILGGKLIPPPPQQRLPAWIRPLLERGLALEPSARHPDMRSLLASFVFTFKVMHGLS